MLWMIYLVAVWLIGWLFNCLFHNHKSIPGLMHTRASLMDWQYAQAKTRVQQAILLISFCVSDIVWVLTSCWPQQMFDCLFVCLLDWLFVWLILCLTDWSSGIIGRYAKPGGGLAEHKGSKGVHGKALGDTSKAPRNTSKSLGALRNTLKALGTTEDQEAQGDIQQALGTTKRLQGIRVRLGGIIVGKQIFNLFLWNKKNASFSFSRETLILIGFLRLWTFI